MDEANNKESKWITSALVLLAIALSIFQVLTASPLWMISGYAQAGIHWMFIVTIFILSHRLKFKGGIIIDLALIILSFICIYALFSASNTLVNGLGIYSQFEIVMAVCQVVLALIIGYRTLGKALPIISVIFLAYALYGNHIPGLFKTAKVSVSRLAPYLLVSTEGMFGSALVTCSRFIFIFVLFGALLDLIGAGSFFVDLAFSVTGKIRGGSAQASICSSMLMGMISGSGPANVVTTGTFTIPLMKKIGFDKNTAGAVEAVASGGGQIMPPVMGSVAFIMSEATGISYGTIALAALVPAALYYLTLSSSVLVYSYKNNVPVVDNDDNKFLNTLKDGWFYLIPIIVLIGMLISGKSAQRCALWAVIATVAVGIIFKRDRFTKSALVKMFVGTAKNMSSISGACLVAGIVVGCINITGFGLKISSIIEAVSGGHLIIMLFLTTIVCLILGMGLPTSASYIVLSVLVAPVIIKMGILKLAAHLFIIYFGSIATLTPPVALAVFAACGISGGTLWKTGTQAMRLAAAGLIVPFVFVYNNELLLIGEPLTVTFSIITAILGCILLSFSTIGWIFKNLEWYHRILLFGCSICLILPRPLYINITGIVIAVLLLLKIRRDTKVGSTNVVNEKTI